MSIFYLCEGLRLFQAQELSCVTARPVPWASLLVGNPTVLVWKLQHLSQWARLECNRSAKKIGGSDGASWQMLFGKGTMDDPRCSAGCFFVGRAFFESSRSSKNPWQEVKACNKFQLLCSCQRKKAWEVAILCGKAPEWTWTSRWCGALESNGDDGQSRLL